jgi:hypothetical protein
MSAERLSEVVCVDSDVRWYFDKLQLGVVEHRNGMNSELRKIWCGDVTKIGPNSKRDTRFTYISKALDN